MRTSTIPPRFGLGTYLLKGDTARASVETALELGYRHIDTAQIYENEAEVGAAARSSGIDRGEIFLTTKIWTSNLRKDRFIDSLKESLDRLQTDYVDLALIHWHDQNAKMSEYLPLLIAAKESGLAKHIGVSNFTIALMQEAIGIAGANVIENNQIEVSPWLQNRKVREFARENGIHITSYMTLSSRRYLGDLVINTIANNYCVDAAAICIAWAIAQDMSVIPSSKHREHLRSNLSAAHLSLIDADLQVIAGLDAGKRVNNPGGLAPEWDI
ncbi:MAG: 2,5-didehydrogluconate reductase DkgB [Helicobacteraceae bacterium]|jgi:2,5-diketo-D-gluconate reductase B|nr:2,5-didehydrogluconate reductase DkgB [Helicobacteraceae bacterium]